MRTKKESKEGVIFERHKWVLHFLTLGDLDVHHGRDILLCHLDNSGAQIYRYTCSLRRLGCDRLRRYRHLCWFLGLFVLIGASR